VHKIRNSCIWQGLKFSHFFRSFYRFSIEWAFTLTSTSTLTSSSTSFTTPRSSKRVRSGSSELLGLTGLWFCGFEILAVMTFSEIMSLSRRTRLPRRTPCVVFKPVSSSWTFRTVILRVSTRTHSRVSVRTPRVLSRTPRVSVRTPRVPSGRTP
jgi:hypothetical protein